MRILFAGATGVLGRATLLHLAGHDVVGLTRSPAKLGSLRELGAVGVVCDVYDAALLERVAREARTETVVNFVTDLAGGSTAANNRARREGGRNLLQAARTAGAVRLVVESVAFGLEAEAAEVVEELERSTLGFGGDGIVVRFGRLWGPGTFHETPPDPPAVRADDAGKEAAKLILEAAAGTYEVD